MSVLPETLRSLAINLLALVQTRAELVAVELQEERARAERKLVFLVLAALCFAIGLLLDRSNLRWSYSGAVLAWSAAAALTATATGFAGLILFRLLLGITESANWPAAMRIVARALPPRDRPLGNGIFTSGTSIGALIAPATILGISHWLGWRWAFAAVGSLGAIWFFAWSRFTAQEAFAPIWSESAEASRVSGFHVYAKILASTHFWRVLAVLFL